MSCFWWFHIEFHGVQPFLFAVPRLRQMIGGNVLLGEVLRKHLPEDVRVSRRDGPGPLQEHLRRLSAQVQDLMAELPGNADVPAEKDRDFLEREDQKLLEQGIVSCDGGHFVALFETSEESERFQRRAEVTLASRVPGLPYDVHMAAVPTAGRNEVELAGDVGDEAGRRAATSALLDVPQLQVCREFGRGPASTHRTKDDEQVPVSRMVDDRRRAADRFFGAFGRTHDVIGRIRHEWPGRESREPDDFGDLCKDGYLAVIAIDGNDIGGRSQRYAALADKPSSGQSAEADTGVDLAREVRRHVFFRQMRLQVRSALKAALDATFPDTRGGTRPYEVLMLGGDDLLLVCRDDHAFDFVVSYVRELKSRLLAGEPAAPMDVAAGVVIAPPNLPFFRLQSVAEKLLKSAKRLSRTEDGAIRPVSALDWMVLTQSWAEDPAEVRRRDARRVYRAGGRVNEVVLQARPYEVLGVEVERDGDGEDGASRKWSFERLWKASKGLSRRAARTQLRRLVQSMERGYYQGKLAFLELERETHEAFQEAGVKEAWVDLGEPAAAVEEEGSRRRVWSSLPDLVELSEIGRLGRKSARVGGGGEPPGGANGDG